jgi:hypothetical protein
LARILNADLHYLCLDSLLLRLVHFAGEVTGQLQKLQVSWALQVYMMEEYAKVGINFSVTLEITQTHYCFA